MRINEIDTGLEPGQKLNISSAQNEHYIDLIRTNCTEALASIKSSGFLYRGVGDNSAPPVFKGRSRENRKSLSDNQNAQIAFDVLVNYFGFKANRSNSIFCSGDKYQAKSYGEVYLIFPIDGFNMLWSSEIRDFVTYADDICQDSMDALNSGDPDSTVPRVVDKYGLIGKNLGAAIQSKNEILINGSYYAFDYRAYAELFYENFIR